MYVCSFWKIRIIELQVIDRDKSELWKEEQVQDSFQYGLNWHWYEYFTCVGIIKAIVVEISKGYPG